MSTSVLSLVRREAEALVADVDARACLPAFVDGSADLAIYANWLRETYHYALWTSSTLALAGERMIQLGRHEAVGRLLIEKSREEYGHDSWALADLAALGFSRADVAASTPAPATAAYIAWVKFLGRSDVPGGYLGVAYVLEHLSIAYAARAADGLVAAARIPGVDRAVRYLRGHAEADGDHVEAIARLLEAFDAPAEAEAILVSARAARFLYAGLLDAVDAMTGMPLRRVA